MTARLTLILGGARSGKSHHAEQLATELGGDSVLYVATAQAFDEEMRARIAQHQAERPPTWTTLEAQVAVGKAIDGHFANIENADNVNAGEREQVVLIDCLTVLTSNIILPFEDPFDAAITEAIEGEIHGLLSALQTSDAHFIIVSNEVGLGLVPPYPLGRAYRDLLGRANQQLAQVADQVLFMVAGLPMTVK